MSTVGPTTTTTTQARAKAPPPPPPPPANLDAEKAKCERQLADWVHCVSASTPTGKAKIEELSTQLDAINASIRKSSDAEVAARPRDAVNAASASATATATARAADAAVSSGVAPTPTAATLSTIGSVVDVYA